MGRVSENDDDKGYGGGRSGNNDNSKDNDTGAGSSQSAAQGRGGQADVGGKNSSTGDSADNGTRDSGSESFLNQAISSMSAPPQHIQDLSNRNIQKNVQQRIDSSKLGIGADYDYVQSLTKKAEERAMSPNEYEIARGIVEGANAEMASQGVKSLAPAVGGLLAGKAIDAAAPSTMHTDYGYSVGRSTAAPNTATNVAANVAGGILGAPAEFGIRTAATAYNSQGIRDLQRAANISNETKSPSKDNDAKSKPEESLFDSAKAAMSGVNAGSTSNVDWNKYYSNRIANRTNS